MKKLMMTAATAAMAGAALAVCDVKEYDCNQFPANAKVYSVSVSLKTTAPAKNTQKAGKETQLVTYVDCYGNVIEKKVKVDVAGGCFEYRKQASKTLKGFIFGSDVTCCNSWSLFNVADWAKIALFDSKTKLPVPGALILGINPIDKKGAKVEATGTLAGLTLAGFGSYSDKAGVKSISGNLAGELPGENAVGACAWTVYTDDCGSTYTYDIGTLRTAAYGTWKISANESMAKKIVKQTIDQNLKAYREGLGLADTEEADEECDAVIAAKVLGLGKYKNADGEPFTADDIAALDDATIDIEDGDDVEYEEAVCEDCE